jgi:hypothetical protein
MRRRFGSKALSRIARVIILAPEHRLVASLGKRYASKTRRSGVVELSDEELDRLGLGFSAEYALIGSASPRGAHVGKM